MKPVISLATILLAATAAFAVIDADRIVHGVIPGGPSKKNGGASARITARDVLEERGRCRRDSVRRALSNGKECYRAKPFCSSTTVSRKVSKTSVQTQYTTVLATSTNVFTSVVAGPSVTCAAAPVPNQTCNYPAYGFGLYIILQQPGTTSLECHELCLADTRCLSFQTENPGPGSLGYCNLFNVPKAGSVQDAPNGGFTFFDRNCPDHLPPECSSAGAVQKRDLPTPHTIIPVTSIIVASTEVYTTPTDTRYRP